MNRANVELAIRDAKVVVIESVWDEAAWGNVAQFRRWATTGMPKVPGSLRRAYEEVLPGCPDD